jgi:hypothetical protein
MNAVDPSMLATAAALLLTLSVIFLYKRRNTGRRPSRPSEPAPVAFQPQAVRVLTSAERQAQQLLSQAMPGTLVLAQVPVTRFLRVEAQQSQWLQQVSGLSADLLLCDSGSRVLVAVSVRSPKVSENSRRRHELLTRLLKSAGIKVLSWNESALPDLAMVRQQLFAVLTANNGKPAQAGPSSRPMSMIPVAEILAEGDADSEQNDGTMEPVASALFDEFAPDLPMPKR